MLTLTHFRLCPRSRSIRIALAELDIDVALAEEQPWQWRPEFLRLNPAAELPVLVLAGGQALCGAYAVSEFLAEAPALAGAATLDLFPGDAAARAEVRRLVDWFHGKVFDEVKLRPLYFVQTSLNDPEEDSPPMIAATTTARIHA